MNDPIINGVSGVILAGGKSSRYGKNKALVQIDGIFLIQKVLQVMQSLFSSVILITNTPETYAFLNIPMHKDKIKGLGPLGGIFTGLSVIPENAGFFVACDMPSLNCDLIRHLAGNRQNFDVVVPNLSGKFEALHALYTKNCLPEIERLIHSGAYQIFRFFPHVSVRYVDENEVRRFDPELRSFFNINRPEQLQNIST